MSKFGKAARVFLILLGFWSLYAEDRAIEWRIEPELGVSSEDRQAILKLLKQSGFEEPARISAVYVLPTGGQLLKAESQVTVDGPHRSWLELSVCRRIGNPSIAAASEPV
jgi:hypothetical protein